MWSNNQVVSPGDLVILWLTRDDIQPLVITPGKDYNNKFGNYRHSDLIGKPYGSKIASRTGKGFVHVLRPTPELWTMALPHRTQILYLADIAFVTFHLDIRPGSVVIEAGTGSGSFSHSVARTIGSTGHLWSYEFHEARANKAREEFERHGMSDVVTLTHRNVCKEGFTVTETADAVFLDLPAPWDAVEHAKKALRKDRTARICCFSPCMEQVLRTVSALNEAGFADIAMYETLLRPHDVSQIPALTPIKQVTDRLKQAEVRREEKRLRQIATSGKARAAAAAAAAAESESVEVGAKRKRDDEIIGDDDGATPSQRVRTESDAMLIDADPENALDSLDVPQQADTTATAPALASTPSTFKFSAVTTTSTTPPPATSISPVPSATTRIGVSKAFPEVKGHTSYLTFAQLVPTASAKPKAVVSEADMPQSSSKVASASGSRATSVSRAASVMASANIIADKAGENSHDGRNLTAPSDDSN